MGRVVDGKTICYIADKRMHSCNFWETIWQYDLFIYLFVDQLIVFIFLIYFLFFNTFTGV